MWKRHVSATGGLVREPLHLWPTAKYDSHCHVPPTFSNCTHQQHSHHCDCESLQEFEKVSIINYDIKWAICHLVRSQATYFLLEHILFNLWGKINTVPGARCWIIYRVSDILRSTELSTQPSGASFWGKFAKRREFVVKQEPHFQCWNWISRDKCMKTRMHYNFICIIIFT